MNGTTCFLPGGIFKQQLYLVSKTNNQASRTQLMSSFGRIFRITTFGESHGKGVGVIVENVPPGMKLSESDIQPQLSRRRPGQSVLTTAVSSFQVN